MKDKLSLPVIPLRNLVVFPNTITPITLGRDISINALREAKNRGDKRVFLVAQEKPNVFFPTQKDLFSYGTVAEILQSLKYSDNQYRILVEGIDVGKLEDLAFEEGANYYLGEVVLVKRKNEYSKDISDIYTAVKSEFENYIRYTNKLPRESLNTLNVLDDIHKIIDIIASHLELDYKKKQKLLEEEDLLNRLYIILSYLKEENNAVYSAQKVGSKRFGKGGRIGGIGEQKGDDISFGFSGFKYQDAQDEFAELREKIINANMSKEAEEKALEELKKLEKMPFFSAEATVVRNYIDWLISLPWKEKSRETRNINRAKKILDEDHYGLKDIKERILEFIAVMQLSRNPKGPILCFVGPPGVGKTSLAYSVARALGRKFVRMSLGGVRDEAEIRGHRRTYVGALPGRIIQMMKKAKTINPVILLDEIDKMSSDFRGNPAYALLEVLDPEQNKEFYDHYLEVAYDLSNVMFIATANTMDGIPYPLLDRMEIIRLSGYTEEEKFYIAKDYLIKKQIKENGLKPENISIPPKNIIRIIRDYTKEAGVRNLERTIGKICRKAAKEVIASKNRHLKIEIDKNKLIEYLGPPKFKDNMLYVFSEPGIANGLAWTELGGEVLTIEVSISKGKGNLILTGKLGEVMKESAQAAFSYARSNEERFSLLKDFYRKYDIHIHVPEGAIPKDGPSAGITIATALISALSGKPVRSDVAMTGEITLRGRVLPIGGLKEKVLAARRMGIKNVIIPKANEKDLMDISEHAKKSLKFHLVERMEEVLDIAIPELEKKDFSVFETQYNIVSHRNIAN